jgi:membrane-associated protein
MFDVSSIIQSGGLVILTLIIFAESGILLGFFLPGDSLLLTAGLFAGQGKLPILWLVVLTVIAAIVGYEVGYSLGAKGGPKLFKRKDGILFREEYIGKTEKFFKKYGAASVISARFVPHVRTFVSVIAGASRMDRRKYLLYNIIGACLWAGGLVLLGYWLGSSIPNIDKLLLPVVVIGLAILYSVGVWSVVKSPSRRKFFWSGLKADFNYLFGRKSS